MTESRVGAEAGPPSSSSPSPASPSPAPSSTGSPSAGSPTSGSLSSGRRAVDELPGVGEHLEFVEHLLARIEAVDPDLHAFVAEPDRAGRLRDEVSSLSRRWPVPDSRPGLYGVPVGVKDVFHADGLPTHGGSQLPAEVLTGPQAQAVTRLREAGAVVAGKTVTAEFAFMAPGPTRNPHRLGHTPGGSSSGSAAAVAAGLVPLALGTQTVGSVVRPAAYCGIVGFKPSYGRIPVDGLIANAPTFDTVGVLTSDVAGAVRAAAVLLDDWDGRTHAEQGGGRPVLGVPEGPYLGQATPEALAAFAAQVARLEAAGYAVRRVRLLADIDAVNERNTLINLVELARSHEPLFAKYADSYHEVSATAIRQGERIPTADYARALDERAAYASDLVAVMETEHIDAWIAPSATGPAPEGLATTGSPLMNLPWTQARLPVVGVPAGLVAGLPVGLQCVARPGEDERLLAWAGAIEATLGERQ
ncbi:amidase [Actinopolymorpha pittospori]